MIEGARRIGLPADPAQLAGLAGSGKDLARLAAALIRVSLSKDAAEEIKRTAEEPG